MDDDKKNTDSKRLRNSIPRFRQIHDFQLNKKIKNPQSVKMLEIPKLFFFFKVKMNQ